MRLGLLEASPAGERESNHSGGTSEIGRRASDLRPQTSASGSCFVTQARMLNRTPAKVLRAEVRHLKSVV
jgi:hypothetical protein